MKKRTPSLLLAIALLFSPPLLADEGGKNEASPAAGSGDASGSLWSKIKSPFSSDKSGTEAKKAGNDKPADGDQSQESGPGFMKSVKGFFSSGSDSKKNAVKVIDIQNVSAFSDVELDPQCKTMVQPFGLVDNALSLAMLTAKLKIGSELGALNGQAANQNLLPAIIKQAATSLNWLPMPAEKSLGEYLLDAKKAQILPEEKNKSSRLAYQNARQSLNDVLAQIHEDIPYEFKIYVIKASTGNAQALPGGVILVDKDIVEGKYDREFAYFKVAHEVSHVLQRHQTRMYQARLADGLNSLQGLTTLMNSAGGSPGAMLPYLASLKNLFVNFTESQELQADACAFHLMQASNSDAPQLSKEVRSIEKKLGPVAPSVAPTAKTATAVDMVKTLTNGEFEKHPNTSQRQQNLEQMLANSLQPKPAAAH